MVGKENLANFESTNISETGDTTLTKIGAHAFDINPYLHEHFEPILFFNPFELYSPWSERVIW